MRQTAMLLTPTGSAAIAVVRLVGPGVGDFMQRYFSKSAKAGRAVHGLLSDETGTIDDPVVVLLDEQTADLNLHGGGWIVRRTLELCEQAGFDVVDQQVFPLISEAVDGDTLMEREVLSHLPMATTDLGVRMLLAQPEAWQMLKQQAGTGVDLRQRLAQILEDPTLELLLHPPRVAIVGPANVGKSTLANQLFAQEHSITADVEGTTRDWVGEMANIDGLPVLLVDTPGLRETDDPIERLAIERSGGQIRQADLILAVLDASRPLEPQAALLEQFPGAVVVLNKFDSPAPWTATFPRALPTIATSGIGVDDLRQRIGHHFGISADLHQPRAWTPRQRNVIERAIADVTVLEHL